MPRLVHLADAHLGFTKAADAVAYAERPVGADQRAAGVLDTFARALDQVIALAPDLIVFAGDTFHVVRPVNAVITFAFKQLQRLRRALPETPIVIVGGNHDQPRTADIGCILDLLTAIENVHIAITKPARFRFGDVSVLAVPEMKRIPPLEPDDAPYRILVLHGEVEGCMHAAARSLNEIPVERLNADRWTYIALGHYHVMREVAPRACYAGSLDYTSSNPWGELKEEAAAGLPGKGFIEVELESGRRVFHHVAPSRKLVDLPSFSAAGLSPAEVDTAIRAAVNGASGDISNAIVRLVVEDVPLNVQRALDIRALKAEASAAFSFRLDIRRPPRAVVVGSPSYLRSGARGKTLDQLLIEKLRAIDTESDVDREALVSLGEKYLREAAERESAKTARGSDAAA